MLNAFKENKVEVVGLADHGNIESSESLRNLLLQNDIIVFPGFEICSAEKIHMVCLFPTNTPVTRLNQILGALQDGSIDDNRKTHPAKKTLLEIAEKVVCEKGIWYAAHIEEDNGLLKTGSFWNIWKEKNSFLQDKSNLLLKNLN
jgi:PHP family Zn ribbon phosphoesterase